MAVAGILNSFKAGDSDGTGGTGGTGTTPSSCPNSDPEMVVTVTGAVGTINWCGETWVLPGDSGVQKTVCPTAYSKQKSTTNAVPGAKYAFIAEHYWRNLSDTVGLDLLRNYHVQYFYYKWQSVGINRNALIVGPDRDSRTWGVKFSSRPATGGFYPTANTLYSDINQILTVTPPYYAGNYNLTGAFFGSHVIGGITYAWAKGNGW